VRLSRTLARSSSEGSKRGTTSVRNGVNSKMVTGNSTAAGRARDGGRSNAFVITKRMTDARIVCMVATVAPNATRWIVDASVGVDPRGNVDEE